MNEFIRTTDELPKISGRQKAAILLTELGMDIPLREKLYRLLNLTPEEQQKLRLAIEGLGSYDPNNTLHTRRENAVLEEFSNYGIKRGLWTEKDKNRKRKSNITTEDTIKNMVDDNPEGVAQILKSWLDG